LIAKLKNIEDQALSITNLSAYDILIIYYKSTTESWRNLTVQASLLFIFMENIKEFNISGI